MDAQRSSGLVAAAMFEHAPCAASLIDGERTILLANPCFERTFGPPAGRRCFEAYKRRTTPCEPCPAERTFLGEPGLCASEQEGFDRTNGTIVYSVQSAPLLGGAGEPLVLLITTDVTRLATLRDELRDAEQLAMVGLTVAGLAHTIKNILAGLEGGTFMIDSGVEKSDADRIRAGWAMVQRYIAQVSTLVKNLLSYARPRDLQKREVEPGSLVQATAALFEDKAAMLGVAVVVEIEPNLPRIVVDEEAVRACLDNLVTNSLDACAWDPDQDKTHRVRLSATLGSDQWVRLRVSDNGTGISTANQKKVLSALFTTKGMRGTGLGLLLTRKAVEAHGGRIHFSSTEGEGSTFEIELPPGRRLP